MNDDDEFYFTFNNETSKKYFPGNSASHFQIYLNQPLNFYDKSYQCALVDFTCSTEMFGTAPEDIYIHFNMCREQLVGNTRDNLVRHTVVRRGKCQMEKFIHPYYMDVRPMNTNLFEICIKDRNGKNVSFLTDITTCTFHFRKKKLT